MIDDDNLLNTEEKKDFNFKNTGDFDFAKKETSTFDFEGGLSVAEEKINPEVTPLGYSAKKRIELEKELDRKQDPMYMIDALKLDASMNFLLENRLNVEDGLKSKVFQKNVYRNDKPTFQELSYSIDPTKGLIEALGIDDDMIAKQYPNLSKKDVYNAVESKFYEQLEIELETKSQDRASQERYDLKQKGIFDENLDSYLRDRIKDDAGTFTNKYDREIAQLVLKLDDGIQDTKAGNKPIINEIKRLKELKEKEGDSDGVFRMLDLSTGNVHSKNVDKDDKVEKDKFRFTLRVNTRIQELSTRDPKQNTREYLKTKYEQNILALSELKDELNKEYTITRPGSEAGSIGGKNKTTRTMSELMVMHDKGEKFNWNGDFDLAKKALREDLKTYTLDKLAYKKMYLLNEGVESVERNTFKDTFHNAIKSFDNNGFYGNLINNFVGRTTELDKITGFARTQGSLGIDMTASEKEHIHGKWFRDGISTGIGGSARFLVEIWGAGKFLKIGGAVVNAVPRIAQFTKWLKGTKSYYDYSTAISLGKPTSLEAGKFFLAEGHIAGHYDATAALKGGAFGAASFGAGRFISGMFKGISPARASLMNYVVGTPISFNAASEFSELANAAYKEWNGDGSIDKYIEDSYGDLSEVTKRVINNGMFAYSLGIGKQARAMYEFREIKNIQFAKDELFEKINDIVDGNRGKSKNYIGKKELNRLGYWHPTIHRKLKNNLSEKDLKTYEKLQETYADVLSRIEGIDYQMQYFNKKDGQKVIDKEHDGLKKDAKENGGELEINVITEKEAKKEDQSRSENNKKWKKTKAITEHKGKKTKITYILEKYFPGVKHHEQLHFEMFSRFGRDAVMKDNFFNNLQNIAQTITLGSEGTKLGGEAGINIKTGEQVTLKDVLEAKFGKKRSVDKEWEYFSYVAEFMSKKTNYYKIRQSNGFYKFKNLIVDFHESMDPNRRYDMSKEKDVVRWFGDYMENAGKGKSSYKLFAEMDNFVTEGVDKMVESGAEYAFKEMKSENLTKSIDTKALSKDLQGDYKTLFDGAQGESTSEKNKNLYRRLTNPALNPDAMYPVVGSKIGPWIDAAIYKYNLKVPDKYRVDLGESKRGVGGARYDLVVDILTDKRGLSNIIEKYELVDSRKTIKDKEGKTIENPNFGAEQKLSTYITGQLLLRLQEIKGRNSDKMSEDTAIGNEGTTISKDAVTSEGVGVLDKVLTSEGGETNAEVLGKQTKSGVNEGIQLRNFEFESSNGVKFKLNEENITLVENKYIETFKNSTEKDTYGPTTLEMRVETNNATNEIFGIIPKIHKTPKEKVAAAIPEINKNGKMMLSSMPKTSSPDFYENSQIAKSMFKIFYKEMIGPDGKPIKYKTSEMSTEEAARTNARTIKYEKLPVTPERVQQYINLITTGRDAGTILKKINMAKQYIGDVLGSQIARDVLNPKTPSGAKFKIMVDNNPALKTKYEVMKMDLAIKRLRGATPDGLKSEVITENQALNIIEQIKGEKNITPEKLYNIVSSNVIDLESRKKLLKDTYNFEGTVVDLYAKEASSKAFLTGKEKMALPITIFEGKYAGFTGKIAEFFKKNKLGAFDKDGNPIGLDTRGFGERVGDKNFTASYQNQFLPKILGEFSDVLLDPKGPLGPMIANSFTFSGKYKFGDSDKVMTSTERKVIMKKIKGVVKEMPFLDQVKLTDNASFRGFVQDALLSKEFKNINTDPKAMDKFVNKMRDYLTPKQKKGGKKVTLEQTINANRKLQKYVYSKIYDYYTEAAAAGPAQAKKAINHISFLLQGQTSITGGFARATATHLYTTTILGGKKVVTKGNKKETVDASDPREGSFLYSEHMLQLMNFNLNILDQMVRTRGNKKAFGKAFDALSEQYHQSITTKETQLVTDADGTTSYKLKDTSIKSVANVFEKHAELKNTVDLRTGQTLWDQTMGIIQSAKTIQNINNRLRKGLSLKSEDLSASNQELLNMSNSIEKAFSEGRKINKESRGMSTFDFDKTAGDSDNFIFASKGGKKKKISADDWPFVGEQLGKEGWKFDFTDFNKVTNGRPGPLMQKMKNQIKKYGPENVFILTARAPESAQAIFDFLKTQGAEIPFKNITGLGNSTGEAKAMWMLKKFSEGYNDMYFVDDALPNVKAVKNVLDQLDIKSSVQLAIQMKSEYLGTEMNDVISDVTGVNRRKISKTKGKMLGRNKYTKSYIVPSAQDFKGLLQNLTGRGKQGEAHQQFYNEFLHDPYSRAHRDITSAEQTLVNDYKGLGKLLPGVKKKLNTKIDGQPFTFDQAVRVHRWTEAGYKIPGLDKSDIKIMNDAVLGNEKLLNFSNNLGAISKIEAGYIKPYEGWESGSIVGDLNRVVTKVGREKYFEEFRRNRELMFGKWENGRLEGPNMAKIEATQGPAYVEAFNDMIWRMETGSNRPAGSNKAVNMHLNYINGSVGATMWFNTRSATLQTISAANYINWTDNNPVKAGKAFLNQKQYWSDFSTIFNSDMLKQRRSGLKYNVSEAELAQVAAGGGTGSARKVFAHLIKLGFAPTQIADSFAIASGGSTFYRNRIQTYIKQGFDGKVAKEKAFLDFQEKTEEAQQSSRPDYISQVQAGPMGRMIFAWGNTPMQYARIQEKAVRDLINGRGDTKASLSKLAYYGVVQNVAFTALQNAAFAFALDSEDSFKDGEIDRRTERAINSMLDTQLRGIGIPGAVLSTVKNTVVEYQKQNDKGYNADHTKTMLQLLSYSPVLGSKFRKTFGYSGLGTFRYNEEAIERMGLSLDNPSILAYANVIEAGTNLPTARIMKKIANLRIASDMNNQWWQNAAAFGGWSGYDLGVENTVLEDIKNQIKIQKKFAPRVKTPRRPSLPKL